MIIELGNTAAHRRTDGHPRVTTIHIPEADEQGLGGYTHKPISVEEFRNHRQDALDFKNGITRLPDNELLLAVAAAWPSQAFDRPTWLEVTPHELTPDGVGADVEAFLHEYFGTLGARKPLDVEETHWTKWGRPGVFPAPPPITALFTDDGRTQQAINYGGGQVGAIGQATAATGTTLTTASTYTTNQWTGYRVYVTTSATNMVWGNVISNTNASNASVLTVDRWYNAATPGGAAGSTPASFTNFGTFMIADGGMVAAWFVGLATGANAAAHGDHTLATNGNAEITTAGGGLIRKIAPYALTSGTSPMTFTLTPVYTANGTDSLPATVTTIGVFTSMVSTFGGAGGPMKFETALNASATIAASGDQLTVTETVTGS